VGIGEGREGKRKGRRGTGGGREGRREGGGLGSGEIMSRPAWSHCCRNILLHTEGNFLQAPTSPVKLQYPEGRVVFAFFFTFEIDVSIL